MKEQLAGASFNDADGSTYEFDKKADNCTMTYSAGKAKFAMTYDDDQKQVTMQASNYAEGQALTYSYAGDPKTTVTLTLVSPEEGPMIPAEIVLTRA